MNKGKIVALNTLAFGMLSASALQYDQNVVVGGPPTAVPGNDAGIYYGGGGNHNGGFTVDRVGQLELGLRAHTRYPSPSDTGISAPTGVYAFNDSTPGISPANRASWNYDFSIWTGTAPLGLFTYELALDKDPSAGTDFYTFNPLLIPDNAPFLNPTIAQNSENYGFLFVGPGIPPYNQNIPGSYDIVLTASLGGQQIAQTAIRVDVNGGAQNVPDGGSSALLLLGGTAGVLCARRANRKS